jgi:hypothetical protein
LPTTPFESGTSTLIEGMRMRRVAVALPERGQIVQHGIARPSARLRGGGGVSPARQQVESGERQVEELRTGDCDGEQRADGEQQQRASRGGARGGRGLGV